MSVDPSAWITLALAGARRAGARGVDLEDAAAHALESFAANPPASSGEAVIRAERRAIDWLRTWYGDTRTPSGRRRRETVTVAPDDLEQLHAGDYALEHVRRLDELERAGLTYRELEAIAMRFAGYHASEIDRIRGLTEGATRMALVRARRKLRSADPDREP